MIRLGAFLILLGFALVGCGTPAPSTIGRTTGLRIALEAINDQKMPPDLTADANAWLMEWKKDSRSARSQYEGKVIELKGEVGEILENPEVLGGFLFLKANGVDQGVRCTVGERELWRKWAPGTQVTVRGLIPTTPGVWTGELSPAVIVEAGPNSVPVIGAQKLAKEFLINPTASEREHLGKYRIITGEIVRLKSRVDEANKLDQLFMDLKGEGNVTINCNNVEISAAAFRKRNEGYRIGQNITVYGQVLKYVPGEAIELFDMHPAWPEK